MSDHGWRIGLMRIVLCAVPMGFAIAGDMPAIDKGTDALRRGQPGQAVQHFTAELAAPDRPIEVRARAFYLRAKAYASLKQPVLARVDLEAALWLKKLSATDAADAERLKSQLGTANAVAAGGVTLAPVTSEALAPVKMAPVKMEAVTMAPPAPVRDDPDRDVPDRAVADREIPPPSSQPNARREIPVPAWSQATVAPAKTVEAAPAPVSSQAPGPVAAAVPVASPPAAPPATETGARSGDIVTGALKPVQQSEPVPQSEIVTGSLKPVQQGEPVPQSEIVTGSPKPVQTPAIVAPQPSATRASVAATTEPKPDQAAPVSSPNLVSGIPLLGALFEKEASPQDAEIASADDLQRRYFEKIRRHNEAVRKLLAGETSALP